MVKAQEAMLERVLEGNKQYLVPLYQRVYSWGNKQIDQLWADIRALAEDGVSGSEDTHFIGSLVLAESPDSSIVGAQKVLVVDGQQRLTTLTLLLAALRDHLAAAGDDASRARINDQFLVNVHEAGQPTKLLPTQADRDAYLAVIRATPAAGRDGRVGATYRHLRGLIASYDDGTPEHSLARIEQVIVRRLALVVVTAQRGDNAHRIFESLNNTGLRLTQSDLLKNYIFMRLGDRAERVYESVWLPLERRLTAEQLELLFWLDLTQRDYRAKQSDTYVLQQRRLDGLAGADEVEADVERIARLADVLVTILDPSKEPDAAVRIRLERIRAWGTATAYPVVLNVLARRSSGALGAAEAAAALRVLESYFVRRLISGRANQGLNRTLLEAVPAIANEADVEISLRRYLSRGRKFYATDAQVREAVLTVPFYWQGRGMQRKLVLAWLEESFASKEPVQLDELTIEHVLPQQLSARGREEFAATLAEDADIDSEHERVVQTLGNLTLTGYNSELSNGAFSEKRQALRQSGIRMSAGIASRERWGIDEIAARGTELAERIISEWPGPDETIAGEDEAVSDLASKVAAIAAEIPPGRWTSYGEVALVAGTYPQPVAAVLANRPIPNAWRVLQSSGSISPGFRWQDEGRADDPLDVLRSEGVEFDDDGRAVKERFMPATELAVAIGMDVGDELSAGWARGNDGASVRAAQREFFEEFVARARHEVSSVKSWATPRLQHWYDVRIGDSRAHISLTVNSVQNQIAVAYYIGWDKNLYRMLVERRAQIEQELDVPLEWSEKADRKSTFIRTAREGDFQDEAQRDALIRWLIDMVRRFSDVFPRYARDTTGT